MGRGGPPKVMKVGYGIQQLWNGRGRNRSGSFEAVMEFGLERAAEPMSVRRVPRREAVARDSAFFLFARSPLPRRKEQRCLS